MIKKIIPVLILSAGLFTTAKSAKAVTVTPTSQVQNITTSDASGEVIKIDGRKLTIKLSNETKEITVPENIQIKKNSLDSNFNEIKVNDKIAYSESSDGKILSLSTTSAEVSDFSKRALPVAVAVLLLAGIAFYVLRKKNDGHIKTTTANNINK